MPKARISLPEWPLPCRFPIALFPAILPPISGPHGYDCFERRLAFGQQSAEPNQKPALTPRSCASLLKVLVLQGDKIHESTLLPPPPKSRLASITRVMKQPREFATLVLSFAHSREARRRTHYKYESTRRRPITWDETRGHDAPHRSLAVPVDLPPAPLSSLSLFFFPAGSSRFSMPTRASLVID
ncbi:hypothetical protein CI102_11633 [Trichoderma harzianum]|nr:hypothetical protein CI102_11633 [Trichoderma harzianum]